MSITPELVFKWSTALFSRRKTKDAANESTKTEESGESAPEMEADEQEGTRARNAEPQEEMLRDHK